MATIRTHTPVNIWYKAFTGESYHQMSKCHVTETLLGSFYKGKNSCSLLLCTETKAWCHDISVRGCDVQLLSTTSSGVLKVSEFLKPVDYFYCNVLLSISLLLQRESNFCSRSAIHLKTEPYRLSSTAWTVTE